MLLQIEFEVHLQGGDDSNGGDGDEGRVGGNAHSIIIEGTAMMKNAGNKVVVRKEDDWRYYAVHVCMYDMMVIWSIVRSSHS